MEEYLTIANVAPRLKIKPKTIKNKIASGVFKRGVHYHSPQCLGPWFRWSAVVAWLEQDQNKICEGNDRISMPQQNL